MNEQANTKTGSSNTQTEIR